MAEAAETLSVDEDLRKLKSERHSRRSMAGMCFAVAVAMPCVLLSSLDNSSDELFAATVAEKVNRQVDDAIQPELDAVRKAAIAGFQTRIENPYSSFNLSASGGIDYKKAEQDAQTSVDDKHAMAQILAAIYGTVFSLLGVRYSIRSSKNTREIKKLESANSKPSDLTL